MFLRGVRVLEVGNGLAGAWAGATFRDLGASVSRLPLEDVPRQPAYLQSLARDKRLLVAESVEQALSAVDAPHIVILDRVEGVVGEIPAEVAGYLEFVRRLNPCVWVTISAFGLSGPDAGQFGSDLTVSAAAGVLAYVRDGSNTPRTLPGRQALLAAGQAGVLAGLHGVDRRSADGAPVRMDVSAQEAMIATGPVLQCAEKMLRFAVRGGAKRFGAPAGWYECVDGRVYIATHEDHQWEGIKRATQPPEPIASLHTAAERIAHTEEIDRFVSDWTARRSKADVESQLQAEGVPATGLNSLEDLRDSPRFGFRQRWRTDLVGDLPLTTMDVPYLTRFEPPADEQPAPSLAPLRLADVRVAEASHILAASLAGALLGAMGADVVKVEDAGRLDQYRRAGPFIEGKEDPEWSGYFAMANHSKRSFVFRAMPELDEVLAGADVIIENWGTSRARRYGVDSASIGRRWPRKLAVSSSGFGHEGPLSGYRVYAYNLNAYCGLLDTLQGPSGELPGLDFAWADFISAYSLATLVAAWVVGGGFRAEAPEGAQVDSAMAEVVVQRLNEVLLEAEQAAAGVDVDSADAGGDLFTTDHGQGYLAVTIRTDEDRKHLESIAGTGQSAGEAELRAALYAMPATSIAAALTANRVAARRVVDAAKLITDTHLRERGFFGSVRHPRWGARELIGLPWRFVGESAIEMSAPPLLGSAGEAGLWRRGRIPYGKES